MIILDMSSKAEVDTTAVVFGVGAIIIEVDNEITLSVEVVVVEIIVGVIDTSENVENDEVRGVEV